MNCTDNKLLITENFLKNYKNEELLINDDIVECNVDFMIANNQFIKKVHIGKNLSTLDTLLFSMLPLLREITIEEDNNTFKAINNIIYSKDGKVMYYYLPTLDEKSIKIKKEVETIKRRCFVGCNNITKITFDENSNLKTIEKSGIVVCDNLEEIYLPNSLETLNVDSIKLCQKLHTIRLSNNLKDFTNEIFASCFNVKKYIVDDENKYLQEINNNIYTIDEKALIAAMDNNEIFKLPNAVERIGTYAFSNNNTIKEFISNDSLRIIDDYAFSSAKKLVKITLPKTINYLGEAVFKDCSSLKEITIPENIFFLPDNTFYNCKSLKKAILPDSLIELNSSIFYHCNHLKEIILGSKIKKIKFNASTHLPNLSKITISSENSYFIFFNNTLYTKDFKKIIKYLGENEAYIIPNNVTTICEAAFMDNTTIKTISYEENSSLVEIDNAAFKNCKNLVSFVFPPTLAITGNQLFKSCDNIDNDNVMQEFKKFFYKQK